MVDHVTPGACVGGPIALAENGDSITIVAENQELKLEVPYA